MDEVLTPIRDLAPFECGEEAAKHFAFDVDYLNLNHGSYGSTPVEVMDVLHHFRMRAERRPDAFVRYEYRTHLLDQARQAVAGMSDAVSSCITTGSADPSVVAWRGSRPDIRLTPGLHSLSESACEDHRAGAECYNRL